MAVVFCSIQGCSSLRNARHFKKSISPNECGLLTAVSGEDRYWALYVTHTRAIKENLVVDYSGISSIDISIPKDAKSIPLGKTNDFGGVVFNVLNDQFDMFLFTIDNKPLEISNIKKKDIDGGKFKKYVQLNKGCHLLSIYDKKPWVENRRGYSYGHIRKDIILVNHGKAMNQTIMPYDNEFSEPVCFYYPIYLKEVTLSNMVFNRIEGSKHMTFLCSITGVDILLLSNIYIYTPQNNKDSDQAIRINDCTNVLFENVSIDGTYSRADYSGYGVSMNNVWNFKATKMIGHGNWGVFGTNNINNSQFDSCDINRYDIHCYGRDVSFNNVVFRDRYNSFSSVYGNISFKNCKFINFVPVVCDASYNAHVGYDVFFKDCEFVTKHDTPQLIYDLFVSGNNSRPELNKKCLPNVSIDNFLLHVNEISPNAYLFFIEGNGLEKKTIDYISSVSIKGFKILYDGNVKRNPADFFISNMPIEVENKIQFNFEDVDIIGNITATRERKGKIIKRIGNNSDSEVNTNSNMKVNSIE